MNKYPLLWKGISIDFMSVFRSNKILFVSMYIIIIKDILLVANERKNTYALGIV